MKDFLHGERVALTAFRGEDAGALAGFEQDSEYLRLYDADVARPRTVEAIRTAYESLTPPGGFVFTVRGLDGAVMGVACLDGILPFHGVGGLSIALGRPFWGQGYGREVLRLVLRFSFNELNLRRLTITVFDYNARAIRLYERLGFVREGVFRSFLVRDGEAHDMLLYGLLRSEWHDT